MKVLVPGARLQQSTHLKRSAAAPVADWSLTHRFEEVLRLAPNHMAPELAAQFRAMITPENVGIIAGTLAAWAVSHAFGAGELVDIVLLALGTVFLGMAVFKAGEDIGECVMTTLHAETQPDLDKAADYLAQAVAILGVVAFFSVVARVGAKFGRAAGAGEEDAAAASADTAAKPSAQPPRTRAAEEQPSGPKEQPQPAGGKPAYKKNGNWDAPRDWEYAPKQTLREKTPGEVDDTAALREARAAANSRTAPAAPDGWPQMPDGVAKTFGADAQPIHLPEGTKLYRVIDSDASADGAYWSLDPPPSSEGAWRGGSAVQDDWNGDGGSVETTVPEGGINVWSGPTAPQPAAAAGKVLAAGDTQIWAPKGTFVPDGPPQPTPWNVGS